ncbi:MAG: hypothetical protein KDE09_11315, partial [Anaerolineales bacterium]|nr:hypothetical protein [Anaerolineales bacterium]
MLAHVIENIKRDCLPVALLTSVAMLATLFRPASTFTLQTTSNLEMLLYRILVGGLVAFLVVSQFMVAQYFSLAMFWSGIKTMAFYAASGGINIIVA